MIPRGRPKIVWIDGIKKDLEDWKLQAGKNWSKPTGMNDISMNTECGGFKVSLPLTVH